MNWHFIEAQWTRLKGKIKEEFGELTDDDIMEIEGKREALIGKLQLRYNISREEAEQRALSMNIRDDDDDDDHDDDKHREHKPKRSDEDKQAPRESNPDIQGEGNYEAAERYRREQHEFAEKMQREGKLDSNSQAGNKPIPLPQQPDDKQATTNPPAPGDTPPTK